MSNSDISKITELFYMFYGCSSLIIIDFSNMKASSLINMDSIFYGCSSLESIDLSNFYGSSLIVCLIYLMGLVH